MRGVKLQGEESLATIMSRFSDDLALQHGHSVYTLPPFADTLNHEGKIPAYVPNYARMNGLYITPDLSHQIHPRSIIRGINFATRPSRRHGNEMSRRKAFFGDLLIDTDNSRTVLPVAVKAFGSDAFNHATQELSMFEYLRRQRIPTYGVVGMLAVANGEAPRSYSITHYQPGFQTLEQLPWNRMSDSQKWHAIGGATKTLVDLHSHAVMHGDYEFKNVNLAENPGMAPPIPDLEYAVSLRNLLTPYDAKTDEAMRLARSLSADFGSLCKSVDDRVIGRRVPDKVRFEDHLEYVYGSYYGALKQKDSPYKLVLEEAFTKVLDDKRRQAYGEW